MRITDAKPKILLTSSLTTGLRYVKKLNLQGINDIRNVKLMNYTVCTPEMLIKEKLIKIKPGFRIISDDESAYILLSLIENKDDGYGLKKYVTSFGAASTLLDVLDDYRYSGKLDFSNLIKADYHSLLDDYKKKLESESFIDYVGALNLVSIDKNELKEECFILPDVYLRPLEESVINSMFVEKPERLSDDYDVFDITKVFSCYGQYAEVAHLLDFIQKSNNVKCGDVEVLYSDVIYENIIKGLCSSRNVPYTLKSNHARSSNYVSFIYNVLIYIKKEYKYELLEDVLFNQGLEDHLLAQFYKTLSYAPYTVGYSRDRTVELIKAYKALPTDEAWIKDFLTFLEKLLKITEDGNLNYQCLLAFAGEYIQAEEEKKNIANSLVAFEKLVDLEPDFTKRIDLILDLLDRVTYSESDDDKSVSFSPITKSFTLRPIIYILGANQTLLLGNDVENPFIEDIDAFEKELFGDGNLHTSKFQRYAKVHNLQYFLNHSINWQSIIVSYSNFDKINLKDMTEGVRLIMPNDIKPTKINPYRIQDNQVVFEKTFDESKEPVPATYDNGIIKPLETNKKKEKVEAHKNKKPRKTPEKESVLTLSPSATGDLISCPFKYYYEKILGIPSIEFPSLNEETWLEPNAKGTFFHRIMELYFEQFKNQAIASFDENCFKKAFETSLKEAESANAISNDQIYEAEKEAVKTAAEGYLRKIIEEDKLFEKYQVLQNEYDFETLKLRYQEKLLKDKKLQFSGKVDRIDGYVDDKDVLHLRVVDYKTGKAKDKKKNPYYQHVLYPYVIETALNKFLNETPIRYEFDKKYKRVIVDTFIYDFTFYNDQLIYERLEFDNNSDDYKKVFNAIDKVVVGYLKNEVDLLEIINEIFCTLYPEPLERTSRAHDCCTYCKYQKECVKRLEWGDKAWQK